MVDDFGIKYRDKKDAGHLIAALQDKYEAPQDWMGGLYFGITLKWDYAARPVDISITSYVRDALHKCHQTSSNQKSLCHQYQIPSTYSRLH